MSPRRTSLVIFAMFPLALVVAILRPQRVRAEECEAAQAVQRARSMYHLVRRYEQNSMLMVEDLSLVMPDSMPWQNYGGIVIGGSETGTSGTCLGSITKADDEKIKTIEMQFFGGVLHRKTGIGFSGTAMLAGGSVGDYRRAAGLVAGMIHIGQWALLSGGLVGGANVETPRSDEAPSQSSAFLRAGIPELGLTTHLLLGDHSLSHGVLSMRQARIGTFHGDSFFLSSNLRWLRLEKNLQLGAKIEGFDGISVGGSVESSGAKGNRVTGMHHVNIGFWMPVNKSEIEQALAKGAKASAGIFADVSLLSSRRFQNDSGKWAALGARLGIHLEYTESRVGIRLTGSTGYNHHEVLEISSQARGQVAHSFLFSLRLSGGKGDDPGARQEVVEE